jgi:Cyclic nucleotide-binding domain
LNVRNPCRCYHSNLLLKAAIKLFQQTQLDRPTLASLANFIVEKSYKKGRIIVKEGHQVEAALYLMRKGRLRITSSTDNEPTYIDADGYFGDDQLLADVTRGRNGPYDPTTITPKYTVQVMEDTTVGILTLAVCRKCLDTTNFGVPHASVLDSLVRRQVPMSELKKHKILGAGTFGQVRSCCMMTLKSVERRILSLQSHLPIATILNIVHSLLVYFVAGVARITTIEFRGTEGVCTQSPIKV